MLPTWLIVILPAYIFINVIWLILMVADSIRGVGNCETPSDFMDALGINKGGAIFIFILYVLIFPLYNLLLWIVRLIYWLFHVGVEDRSK